MIAIRGVFKSLGLATQPGQESAHAPEFLSRMNRLAEKAGGDARSAQVPRYFTLDGHEQSSRQ